MSPCLVVAPIAALMLAAGARAGGAPVDGGAGGPSDCVPIPAASDADIAGLEPELASRPPLDCTELAPPTRSTWRGTLWPGGVVPFGYSVNTTPSMRAAMCEAMDELHTVCNVTFVPHTTQSNFLLIQDSTGNNSYVGMIGGSQTVNIFNWNYKYIMCHELMHALGETHEQSRPDRDTFVRINTANICQDCCSGGPCNGNFNISSSATTVGAYDFESVMHYGATAFSVNGQPTIECLPPYTSFQSIIGNRDHLSAGDKTGLAARYGPPVDDAYEPNDSFAAPAVLPISTANLLLIDRDDYFRVHLSGAAAVSVIAWVSASAEAAQLTVYSLAGVSLATQSLAPGPASGQSSATASLTAVPGDYIVRLGRSCGQGGAYTLTISSTCPADINQSGSVTVQDIFDFMALYFANTPPSGDFNGSGAITVQDIFDFLAAYFTPCP